jgi:predicted O-methyltransferase YrrM
MAMFRAINGWLHDAEANRLFDIAEALPNEAPVVVELGSWLGKSSVVLSQALAGKKGARLFCVDPFNADGEEASTGDYQARKQQLKDELQEVFRSNMRKHGRPELAEEICAYSFDAVKKWSLPIDFLFIDASHDHEDVAQDFRDWSTFIKPGGYVAFHDVDLVKTSLELTGPGKAAKEAVADSEEWEESRLIHSVFSARRKA